MEPILRKFSAPWPVLVQAATWTVVLMITVAFVSFAPEMAFVSTLSSSSSCDGGGGRGRDGFVRIPIDLPGEMVCVPSETVNPSSFDVFVPTVFAGVMVVASVSLIRSCFGIESVVV